MAAIAESPPVHSTPAVEGTESHAPTRAGARESTATAQELLRRFTGRGLLTSTPATLADVIAYTRAGGWVPGERVAWLEWVGKTYGWLVAVPVTGIAYLGVWFIQRPTRLLFGLALLVAARWAL